MLIVVQKHFKGIHCCPKVLNRSQRTSKSNTVMIDRTKHNPIDYEVRLGSSHTKHG